MTEFELKLEIPPAQRDAVRDRVLALGAHAVRLRALYLDTPQRALARAGVAWRLRQEGADWVQTAKGPGASPLERLEHDAPVATPPGDAAPTPDPARHDGTPLGARIRAALQAGQALEVVFSTDVQRLQAGAAEGDALLELALDTGHIAAAGRSHALNELEIERKRGPALQVIAHARGWIDAHGLWISTISKAQRGRWLAEGGVPPGALAAGAQPPAADAAGLARALGGVLEPASVLAGGEGDAGHARQLQAAVATLAALLPRLPGSGPDGLAAAAVLQQAGSDAAALRAAPVQHALLDLLSLQLRLAGG